MKRHILITCVTLFLLIVTSAVQAQIPRTLSYQGVLTDVSGTPRADGSYSATFRIYDVASGGTALWSDTKTIETKKGLFSAVLGDPTAFPLSMKFDEQYWLAIQIGAETQLYPRIALTSVAYSQNSVRADTATVCINGPCAGRVWSATLGSDTPYGSTVTNLVTLNVTTHGGTVVIMGKVLNKVPSTGYRNSVYLYRGNTFLDRWSLWTSGYTSEINESAFVMATEALPAGTYTYYLKAYSETKTRTALTDGTKLTVMEF